MKSIRFYQNIKLLRHTSTSSAAHSLGNTALGNCRFFGHNLLITNARMPIKGSQDADFRLVFF